MSNFNIDDFIEKAEKLAGDTSPGAQRYAEVRGRRDKEVALWHHWNTNGRQPEHLEPLLASIHPMIRSEATKRLSGLGGSIPRTALENALRTSAVKSIEKYDPSKVGPTGKPAQLSTFIKGNFQSVTDFIAANRNARYTPRAKLDTAGEFLAARDEFTQQHGRPPTLAEMKSALPTWKPKRVQEVHRALAPEVFTNMGTGITDDENSDIDKYRSAVILVYGQLSDQERQFADLHYPAAGETPLTIKQIAKKLGIPEQKVYRLRNKVDNHLAPLVKSS